MQRLFQIILIGVGLVGVGSGCGWEAQLSPGQMYVRALQQDALGHHQEAGYWYRKAAYHGHSTAQLEVGFMYTYGRTGFLRDAYEVERWFRTVIRKGAPVDRTQIGYAYELGPSGVLIDSREAERWFRKAVLSCREEAARGNLKAQTWLGLLYSSGKGVERDLDRALRLWHGAAERGYAPAQLNVARYYWYEGEYEKARPWMVQAAEQGIAAAEYKLSEMYQWGRGVPQDRKRAAAWLRRASNRGYVFARRQVRSMEEQGLLLSALR